MFSPNFLERFYSFTISYEFYRATLREELKRAGRRKCKKQNTESGHEGFCGDDVNVLKLDYGNSCSTL